MSNWIIEKTLAENDDYSVVVVQRDSGDGEMDRMLAVMDGDLDTFMTYHKSFEILPAEALFLMAKHCFRESDVRYNMGLCEGESAGRKEIVDTVHELLGVNKIAESIARNCSRQ